MEEEEERVEEVEEEEERVEVTRSVRTSNSFANPDVTEERPSRIRLCSSSPSSDGE